MGGVGIFYPRIINGLAAQVNVTLIQEYLNYNKTKFTFKIVRFGTNFRYVDYLHRIKSNIRMRISFRGDYGSCPRFCIRFFKE